MRDTVQDEFARFAETAAGTFRPLPLDMLPPRRRYGRLRVWLAGVAVALVAAGGGVALRTAVADRPTPAPSGFRLVDRPVVLAGATGPHQVVFADRRHGWVLFGSCAGGTCDPRLGSTDDGGLTWRPRTLPKGEHITRLSTSWPGEPHVVVDAGRISWSSGDGGDTWTTMPRFPRLDWVDSPDQIRACHDSTDGCVAGRLLMEGVGDIGVTPVRAGWFLQTVVRAAGGALWAVLNQNSEQQHRLLLHSADGVTWQDVRETAEMMSVEPSPDRSEIWYLGDRTGALALLVDGRAVDQPSLDDSSVVAIGGGRLVLMSGRKGLRLWTAAGGEEAIPVPVSVRPNDYPTLQMLDDGAVAVGSGSGERLIVGTIGGTWIRYG